MPYDTSGSFSWSFVFTQMICGFIAVGMYARRKNRSFVAWGLFGAVSALIAAIVLAMQPRLCGTCQAELPRGCDETSCEPCATSPGPAPASDTASAHA